MEINGRESPSNRIRFLRKSKRLKQDALAKKAGCSRSALSRWENDESFPPFDVAVKIARKLKCNVEDLYPNLFEKKLNLKKKKKRELRFDASLIKISRETASESTDSLKNI